jgi:hypothetical protein
MAWIESHQALKDHPKTLMVCEELILDRYQVIGHLHLLWYWCIDYAPSGDISKFSDYQIERAAEWPGNRGKLVNALIKAGFIDRDEKSTKIHDWMDFCGPLMERRLLRMKHKRPRMAAKRPQMESERPPTNQPTNLTNLTNLTNHTDIARSKFAKPTAQKVTEYAKSIGFLLDGSRFVDYYESNGWKVGKNPMKDWKACVRTWKKNGYSNGGGHARTSAHIKLDAVDPERVKAYE